VVHNKNGQIGKKTAMVTIQEIFQVKLLLNRRKSMSQSAVITFEVVQEGKVINLECPGMIPAESTIPLVGDGVVLTKEAADKVGSVNIYFTVKKRSFTYGGLPNGIVFAVTLTVSQE
jgi:hypothetical protein